MKEEHECYQLDKIDAMHKILVGNGEPEKSLVSQVLLMNERQTKILETLEGMKLARRNVIPYIINIIGAISALTLMYFGYQGLRNQGEEIRSETKTTNELLSPSTSRSGTYNPFTTDTIR